MRLLEVDNLSVTFRQGKSENVDAVKGVSFSLEPGGTLALVGESGSGKSVTALSVLGLLPYPLAAHPTGSVRFMGQELLRQPEAFLQKIRGASIGMIFQEPMTALNPLHTIEKQIAESLLLHKKLSKTQAKEEVINLLQRVGFSDGVDRLSAYPHQLSGGQRQRVMIAMALACAPKLLIADEPTTALDVTLQANILDLIKDLQREFNMGLLLISHDLGVVSYMTDHMVVMRNGLAVEQGKTQQILKAPQHPYTQHLIAAEPRGEPAALPQAAKTVMEAKNISVTFKRTTGLFMRKTLIQTNAVADVSLSVRQGETIGIVGESGSGKSTLAYALLRLQALDTGSIRFKDQSLEHLSLKQMRPLRKFLQIIFQDPFASLNPRLSVGQIVSEGVRIFYPEWSREKVDQAVIQSLDDVGLTADVRHRYPHEFSGGQRQRIAIARALILNPEVVVLDEPTSALDRSIQAEVIELLRTLQAKYQLTYLFISHDLKVIRAMSHQIIVMKNGCVVEQGSTEDIFCAPKTPYTQNLLKAAFQL